MTNNILDSTLIYTEKNKKELIKNC